MKTDECIRLPVSPLSVSLNETHRLAISPVWEKCYQAQ